MTVERIREALQTPFQEGLLRRTYDSIVGRLQPDGYFPESLNGVYDGMFPRTTGGMARLLLEVDELERAEANIHYCIQASVDNRMERIAHVIGPREENGRIRLLDGDDEIDGQAHVLLAWALLAERRGRTPFEDLSYPIVAKLMDRTVTQPYLYEDTARRIRPGLVRNVNLEHNREGEFWDTYDILTQSFVCAALERMIPIAIRQGDPDRCAYWTDRLRLLVSSTEKFLVREMDGKRVYLEMLFPTGREPEPYPGISWLNLAPIPSGWQGVNQEIFQNTIETWHRVAAIKWDGPRMTSCDWLPEGHVDRLLGRRQSNMVIGKMVGWDLLYCHERGQYDRVLETLQFLEQVNKHELLAEAFCYEEETGSWRMNDPGNGEQVCWWSWGMVVLRKAVGLPALPPA